MKIWLTLLGGGSIIKTAKNAKDGNQCTFDVTSGTYYYLVLTFSNGNTLTSNVYFVAPSKSTSTVGIENSTPSTSMINGQIYNGSKVTLGIKTSDMDWLSGQKNLIYTLQQYNPYATSASDQWENVGTSSTKKPGQFSFPINQGDAAHKQFVKYSQGEYRFKITNSQNPNYKLYSNPISLSTYSTPSLSLTINGTSVTPNSTNYYQMENGSKVTINVNNDGNHWNTNGWKYQWQYYDQTTGQWSNINGQSDSNYSFDLNSNSHTTYRVHITTTDNTGNIIVDMNSNQIIIVSKQLNVVIEASSPTNGSTTYNFGDTVNLKINQTTGIDLSNGTYTYTWQYYDQAESQWKTFQINPIGPLKFVTVRSCEWRLWLTNGNGLSIYSNEIYLNTTMPTLTVSVKDKDGTAATSFPLGSVVNISTNSISLSSYLSQNGTGTTTISNLNSSWSKSTTSGVVSNYVLGANAAFKATYTYSYSTNNNDSANTYYYAYYDFSIPSTILYVNVTANPPTIVASTDNDATPAVNTTYTFNVGTPVNLGIEGGSSWASYNPTGYTLKYQWYQWNSQESKFEKITNNGSSNTYTIPSNSQPNQYQLEITCTGNNTTFSVMSNTINIIYGAIPALSIKATYNDKGTSTTTTSGFNAQLGQGFSVSLNKQSITNVNALLNQKDVHGYWVKVVNGQESVIQTTSNSKQIFYNAFLNSTEFKTIMQSYIALGGYGNYLGNTATYDDFENWNVSFQELGYDGYGNNVFGILNCLVVTATNNKQITVDKFDTSKNTWVPGVSVPASSLFTWTLPYTWIDSNNSSNITPTVSGTSSGSTSMTLDYLTYKTTSLTQSQFDSAFSTKDGQRIFGFSVTDPNTDQQLVPLCPFNFTSSDNSHGSYSSFVKNITVTVNSSSADNYTNVPLTAIDNETIKYIVTKNNSDILAESNPIFVTVPNLDSSTLSVLNFPTGNGSDTAQNPFKEISNSYYQVPYDQTITLSSNVTSNIASLNEITPGYNFYIGYFFNGNYANWHQLLNTGSGYWSYNFYQVQKALNFNIYNFPIANYESIQFVLFYTPDNTTCTKLPNGQFQPKDLNKIWISNKITFTIAHNMDLIVTPPSGTSLAEAKQAGFSQLGNTYHLPTNGAGDYVITLNPNAVNWWNSAQGNVPFPSMHASITNPWINTQLRSKNTVPNRFNATYSFGNIPPQPIYNDYGIIGEFLEIQTAANPNWSIFSTWFPNLYSMFAAWVADGPVAWKTLYNAWKGSSWYHDAKAPTYNYTPFLPSPLVYPVQIPINNGDDIGQTIIDGVPYSVNNHLFSGNSSQWYWYFGRGNYQPWDVVTEKDGIGSDFNTQDPNNILFNYNTNVNAFVSGTGSYAGRVLSEYSYSAYAPLQFSISAILFNQQIHKLTLPCSLRLVVFALNPQVLNNTYYTTSDTFADVGLQVFNYTTPAITIE